MKKYLLLLSLLLVSAYNAVYAQNYVLEYDVEFFLNSGSRRFYNRLYYKTSGSQERKEVQAFKMYRERREHFRIEGKTLISASEGPIVHMWDESSRQLKLAFWFGDGEHNEDFFIGDGTQTEFSRTNLDWGSLDTYYSRVVTHKFMLYPELLFDAVQPQLLPLKDRVILKNQAGFPRSVYRWQYSLDAGASWIDIPASLIDSSPLGSLSIEGKDLMTEAEYLELVRQGKNIQFRIDNPVKPSSTITLRTSISTPHILSSEISLERCNNSWVRISTPEASSRCALKRPVPPEAVSVMAPSVPAKQLTSFLVNECVMAGRSAMVILMTWLGAWA